MNRGEEKVRDTTFIGAEMYVRNCLAGGQLRPIKVGREILSVTARTQKTSIDEEGLRRVSHCKSLIQILLV